jgi:HK97 family phage portal protein
MGLFGLQRARPRGKRPELPAAVPGSNVFQASGQWGDIPLPLAGNSTVLGLPAAGRAVNLIANAVATMAPMQQIGTDGFVILDGSTPVLERPNAGWGVFDFFHMAAQMAIMRGNFLGLQADFSAAGYPNQIVPVPTGYWYAYIDGAGYTVYSVKGQLYSCDEVIHIRANSLPNAPMGIGVVEQYRRAIGHALDQQNFAADTYRSGSVPAGIINLDLPEIDVDQANAVQAQWIASHASGGRAPAVLPNNMEFEPIQWSPEDLQFLEARLFTVSEIAHMFNLDPTDLGAAFPGDSLTYTNIEQRQTQRIVDTYGPWMRRFEDGFSDLIPSTSKARLVPANLLRTDSKTRAEVDQIEIANQTLTPAEARKREGKKPIPQPKLPDAAVAAGPDGKPVDPAAAAAADPATAHPDPIDPNITVKGPTVKL